jgi:uncharacterized membrane protein YqjE
MASFLNNQIAMALLVFVIIVVGALWRLEAASAKEVIVQVITAIGALVTGIGLERLKNQRSTYAALGTVTRAETKTETKTESKTDPSADKVS